MPAGMAATAQAAARPIMKIRKPRPVGSSPRCGVSSRTRTAIADVIMEHDARDEDRHETAGETDPQPDGRADRRALGIAAHDPFGRPQEQPIEPATVGNSSRRAPLEFFLGGVVVVEERLDDQPAQKRPQPAGQAQVEIARVEHADDERLRRGLGQRPVEHRLLVEEGLDPGREQVVGGQAKRFARARRRHEPNPRWVVASCERRIREVSVCQASGVAFLPDALVLPSPGFVADGSGWQWFLGAAGSAGAAGSFVGGVFGIRSFRQSIQLLVHQAIAEHALEQVVLGRAYCRTGP